MSAEDACSCRAGLALAGAALEDQSGDARDLAELAPARAPLR